MDPHTMYLDNLGGCNDDGYFEEPEPEEFDACMDRLHLLLAAHFSALGVTTISQIQERK